jgi:hypothetical protein
VSRIIFHMEATVTVHPAVCFELGTTGVEKFVSGETGPPVIVSGLDCGVLKLIMG